MTAVLLGFMLFFIILIETTFGIYGIGLTFIDSIQKQDYWVLNGVLFVITIFIVIISSVSNLIFTALKSSTSIPQTSFENLTENNKMDQVALDGGEIDVENYTRKRLVHLFKSPFTIIGLIIIGILIIIAIFAEEISGFSYIEVMGLYVNPFAPPCQIHREETRFRALW